MRDVRPRWMGRTAGARGTKAGPLPALDEGEELLAGLLLRAEAAEHAGRHGHRAGLLDTAHGHTHVPACGRKTARQLTVGVRGRL